MSKLTDKIEKYIAHIRQGGIATTPHLEAILADVRELESDLSNGAAYEQGYADAQDEDGIRQAKLEAYQHARKICIKHAPAGMSAHKPLLAAYDDIGTAIDALDEEVK